MPTYEYKCEACGNTFEKFQSITAAPIRKCPRCGKARVRRLIGTGAGLIFKGSGFYITDYRDQSYKDRAKADSGATGSDSKAETKAETKSETKAETKSGSKAESKPASESKPKATPKDPPRGGGRKK